MPLYPSLEALTIGNEVDAQNKLAAALMSTPVASFSADRTANYNLLANEILGLDLSLVSYDEYGNACYGSQPNADAIVTSGSTAVVLPVSNNALCKDPVEVSQSVRELSITKNKKGFIGVQLRSQDRGVFVTFVEVGSPAATAGLRFGDQVLKINDKYTTGLSGREAMDLIRNSSSVVTIIIRDRPLERVVTLAKDSLGGLGILIKNGSIEAIVKDSSAARNGVLINSQLVEVNGINVLGIHDKDIRELIKVSGQTVKVTLIPGFYFDHLSKKLGRKLLKNMDRSEPVV